MSARQSVRKNPAAPVGAKRDEQLDDADSGRLARAARTRYRVRIRNTARATYEGAARHPSATDGATGSREAA